MSARIVLDLVCTLVACGGIIYAQRMRRARAELAARHRRLLETRSAELEEFAGRVAHDVLSPLQTVGFALALADRDPRARQRGQAALQRVKTLVDGLLDFARAGGRPPQDAQSDVGATIHDLVDELRPTAAAVGTRMVVASDARATTVRCNAGVLTSVLANLMRNAIKYVGQGIDPRIAIRVLSRGSMVRVEVEDTGPGLPPDFEQHVFEPYARAAGVTAPGFGLGLATVKRLVEAHGGAVGVKSIPGKGCTFWFTLPKVDVPSPGSTPELVLGVAS